MNQSIYSTLGEQLLSRMPTVHDGCTEQQLSSAEARLNVSLPVALREFYVILGANATIMAAYNRVLHPDEVYMSGDYLVFMEENQNVVSWGVHISNMANEDPEVWQLVNCDPPEAYAENMSVSEFLVKMLQWQAGLGPPY